MHHKTIRWTVLASLALPCAGAAAGLNVSSQVDGIRIAASDRLPPPHAPQSFEDGDFCANIRIEPVTPAGRHAASLGWYVTSEVEEAGYTAVGIFSRGGNATSGTCLVTDGNVVLYRGDEPAAIVYEPSRSGNEAGRIGGVFETLTKGRVRISDWTPPGYVHADIELRPRAITVVPIAALETACGGIGLPDIHGKTLPVARKLLARHGWEPENFTEDSDPRILRLREAGITEVEGCSGTGYGFCSVHYSHGSGARLQVTTTGDEPQVANYGASCATGTDRASEGFEDSGD